MADADLEEVVVAATKIVQILEHDGALYGLDEDGNLWWLHQRGSRAEPSTFFQAWEMAVSREDERNGVQFP